MFIPPILFKDFYKVGHKFQYPKGTNKIVSNDTARASRYEWCTRIVPVLMQYFVLEFLIKQFNERFFSQPKDNMVKYYRRRVTNALGPTNVDHIANLHELGYLPFKLKAVPEGTFVPLRVPFMTMQNTHDDFGWLTNMLETLISSETWQPINNCTVAVEYLKNFIRAARKTGAPLEFVQWQGHDFSMRGMPGIDAATKSGAAHLLAGFTGTDTITAIDLLEWYYGANSDVELVGGSVPATEHSVMSMYGPQRQREAIKTLITEVYPAGIVSIVCDTFDFWEVVTKDLPALKEIIMARIGKVVTRPDSGDPVDIVCGDPNAKTEHEFKGVIQLHWENFDGVTNSSGFKRLDSHIGNIYGDSITLERQREMLLRLEAKGFESAAVGVLGIGSFTYQHNTRDSLGQAIKATYGEVNRVGKVIFKQPKTDSGLKNSAKGLLMVDYDQDGVLRCFEEQTWDQEVEGILQTIFEDGKPQHIQTAKEIRARIMLQILKELNDEEA